MDSEIERIERQVEFAREHLGDDLSGSLVTVGAEAALELVRVWREREVRVRPQGGGADGTIRDVWEQLRQAVYDGQRVRIGEQRAQAILIVDWALDEMREYVRLLEDPTANARQRQKQWARLVRTMGKLDACIGGR